MQSQQFADEGFEFECYQRDKLVEKDKRQLQGFLSEQKKDQEMDRAYSNYDRRGAPPAAYD